MPAPDNTPDVATKETSTASQFPLTPVTMNASYHDAAPGEIFVSTSIVALAATSETLDKAVATSPFVSSATTSINTLCKTISITAIEMAPETVYDSCFVSKTLSEKEIVQVSCVLPATPSDKTHEQALEIIHDAALETVHLLTIKTDGTVPEATHDEILRTAPEKIHETANEIVLNKIHESVAHSAQDRVLDLDSSTIPDSPPIREKSAELFSETVPDDPVKRGSESGSVNIPYSDSTKVLVSGIALEKGTASENGYSSAKGTVAEKKISSEKDISPVQLITEERGIASEKSVIDLVASAVQNTQQNSEQGKSNHLNGKQALTREKSSSKIDDMEENESPSEDSPPPREDGGSGSETLSGPNTLRRRSGRNSQKNKKRRRSKIYNF